MKNFKAVVGNFVLGENSKISNRRIALFLLFINVITSAAVSIYIPCLKQMAIDLETTNTIMQMTIVAHLTGEFIGRILCGSFLEMYGNRAVILPSLLVSVLGHLGCMISGSAMIFTAMRFIQAIGSSVVYAVSQNVINKVFNEKEKSRVMGILELYQPIAWILSPFVGSILAEISNWRVSFLVLSITQLGGVIFFWFFLSDEYKKSKESFAISRIFYDYGYILRNSAFVIYALIPGLFAGGYMIFATSAPFICLKFFGNKSADIALFSAVPLFFYVIATFVYRNVVDKFGMAASRRTGACIYGIFGIYLTYLIIHQSPWTPYTLLVLMSLQCSGSAFLVPVSVLKALQSTAHYSTCVGASTVVIFRNIIMSICITAGAKFSGNITTIMSCVFMTVATVLVLITTRKIIRTRITRRQKALTSDNLND
ncbi:MAG: MFS transporter [Holosporaceae bacterium]|jgi:DHA1 family bicyclomycin/chloramphenicol resistance-like MFS transporter|nr:MFS transporter [Holosporaceae bacterium]